MRGGGGCQMEKKGTTSWLGWPTQRLPNFCPRSLQESQTRSRPAWLAGLHGTILSRVGVVFPFLLPCSIQTSTRQRLILTTSPINLDLFRYFGGWRPPHCLRTNLSFFNSSVRCCAIFCSLVILSRRRQRAETDHISCTTHAEGRLQWLQLLVYVAVFRCLI